MINEDDKKDIILYYNYLEKEYNRISNLWNYTPRVFELNKIYSEQMNYLEVTMKKLEQDYPHLFN